MSLWEVTMAEKIAAQSDLAKAKSELSKARGNLYFWRMTAIGLSIAFLISAST